MPEVFLTTDLVIFTVRDAQLTVLLARSGSEHADTWRLPGGIAEENEDLDAAAGRHLAHETGLSDIFLEQLYTFGRPNRDPRGRYVSVAYFALVPVCSSQNLHHGQDSGVAWHSVYELPPLVLDHEQIVRMAHRRLAAKLRYSTIGLQLMPRSFTLSAVQMVYEAILREQLDKRNFRKRLLGMGCLEKTGHEVREGNHRPARLYRLKSPRQVRIIK